MSAASDDGPPRSNAAWRRARSGCGLLFALASLSTPVAWVRAERRLAARVRDLEGRVEALRSAGERPPLLDRGPPLEGNAVDDYRALEWVLGPRDGFLEPPPTASPIALARAMPGPDLFSASAKESRAVYEGRAPTPAGIALAAPYRSLRRHVQDALRRRRCDWPLEPGPALRHELTPHHLALRGYANLMVISAAAAADPRDAAEIGLELIAVGSDLRRGDQLTSMIGVALEYAGARTLALALRRPELPRAVLERVVDVLGRVPARDPAHMNALDRIVRELDLARRVGRPVVGLTAGVPVTSRERLGALAADAEWSTLLERYRALEQIVELPYSIRGATWEAVYVGHDAPWALGHGPSLPNLYETGKSLEDGGIEVELARALAAAHLHRLDHGAFPATVEALAPYLGATPVDPYRDGAPLSLALAGDELRLWSWGEDLTDQGGTTSGRAGPRDLVMSTVAPTVSSSPAAGHR